MDGCMGGTVGGWMDGVFLIYGNMKNNDKNKAASFATFQQVEIITIFVLSFSFDKSHRCKYCSLKSSNKVNRSAMSRRSNKRK